MRRLDLVRTSALFLILLMFWAGEGRGASEGIVPEAVIGTVPVSPRGAVRDVYRRIDLLVPELRKVASEKIVLLECLYRGQSESEGDVSKALGLAALAEKYLREHHKLQLDLWLAAHPEMNLPGQGSSLIFSVLSDSYVTFDRTPPEPVMQRDDKRDSSGDTP